MISELEETIGCLNCENNHLIIEDDKKKSSLGEKGLDIKITKRKGKLFIKMIISKKLLSPINICYGILTSEFSQKLDITMILEKNSKAKIISNCVFPKGKDIEHIMDSKIILKNNSELEYKEIHTHKCKNIKVVPHAKITIGKNAKYINEFILKDGNAGIIDFDYVMNIDDNGKCDFNTKIQANKNDNIKIREIANLNGKKSSAILISKIVLNNSSKGEVYNKIVGIGNNSKGHVDCTEILNGKKSNANAIPIIEALNPTCEITHEASVGRVNKDALITLLSKGLNEKEAINIIINGILK